MSHRAVKIIATVGPAIVDNDRWLAVLEAGVNLFRFNFAHGTREVHAARIQMVRALAEAKGQPVGILADISGPKIRLGELAEDPFEFRVGKDVLLRSGETDGDGLPVQLPRFDEYVNVGDPIYVADGTRKLVVTGVESGAVRATVEVGGPVTSHKGINLPMLRKPLPPVGEKDLLDVEAALDAGADWIGLSFVGDPDDVKPIRELMARKQLSRPVLAKLERRRALNKLEEIIAAFDGVMVARGDLGIEVEFEKVPSIQDRILRIARDLGKPAIVATQILTSMVRSPRPTRAEATDVAYAVAAGADALMLSEETAIGDYPVEAVQTIVKVAREVESVSGSGVPVLSVRQEDDPTALAHTAVALARDIKAAAILCPTTTGDAARAVARFQPAVPIVAVSDSRDVVGELTLYRGVHPHYTPLGESLDERIRAAIDHSRRLGLTEAGSKLVLVGGVPTRSGRTNLLLIYTV
ncbi:pyruvate kinase [bacterium]|nr:pyruvate kinase [bacterium]MBU1983173.1 pyruvate kinase [bacterium]